MILEIPAIVGEVAPGLLPGGAISVACVRTTRPQYLVFGADARRPLWVVQEGPSESLRRTHEVLIRLHRELPDLVAEPIACVPWRDGRSIQIQAGLPGDPWFRLADRLRSRAEWDRLRERAAEALDRLHSAVANVAGWTGPLRPSVELERVAALCEERGVRLSLRARGRVEAEARALRELGEIASHWQHGDYCVNNLLVTSTRVGIIDFEEFGATAMPLHDEIGLALSVHDFASRGEGISSAGEDLAYCVSRGGVGTSIEGRHVAGLLLHHLLWRINQSLDRPTRGRVRPMLIEAVERFSTSPTLFPAA